VELEAWPEKEWLGMYEREIDDPSRPPQRLPPNLILDAREVAILSALMRELRDTTQSRSSFRAASAILRRLGAETESPRLVTADLLDG
jgi:hypothetical protein